MLSKRLLSCADLDGSSEFQASRFKGERLETYERPCLCLIY